MPGAAQKAVLVTLGRIFLVLLIAGVTPAPALSGVPRTTPDDPGRLWSQFPLEEGAPPAPRPRPAPPARPQPAPGRVGVSSGPQRLPGPERPLPRAPEAASDGSSSLPLGLAAGLLALVAILLTAMARGRGRAAPASAPTTPQPAPVPPIPVAPSLEPLEAERQKQHASSGELHSLGLELRELAGGVTLEEPAEDLRGVIARARERGAAVQELLERPPSTQPAAEEEEADAQTHLLFLPAEEGYQLVEKPGQPPPAGSRVDGLLVGRVGPSPLPLDERRCAYLERV